MNLAIVTTLGANAGDNFIYEGFKRAWPQDWAGNRFLIDKTRIPHDKSYRRWVDAADLVVICGSPILYWECYKMHWQRKLLDYCERRDKPMLLFGIGSNFPCTLDGQCKKPDLAANPEYREFLERYHELAWRPISVRDPYAWRFLEQLGLPVVPLPCPSLLARPVRAEPDGDWIGIIWGETYWQAGMSARQVFRKLTKIEGQLQRVFTGKQVVWFAHDEPSYHALSKRQGRENVLFCTHHRDYYPLYERCAVAVSTKVHGSMLLASMGIPSVLFELDTRATTLHAVGEWGVSLRLSHKEIALLCRQKWEAREEFRERVQTAKQEAMKLYQDYF